MMKRIIEILKMPLEWYRARRAFKKRMDELRKRDPFIYK
jgi:hypothetical protein